ncbi:adenylate/guanylate cyclase domain-containing protein [Lutimonas sp.]|uniref:adenylate/guanylate cyclase domain-containing protein n=1 Tax=Lutimonas sp. TaxID=1872403 RepID=UPI003D9AC3B2
MRKNSEKNLIIRNKALRSLGFFLILFGQLYSQSIQKIDSLEDLYYQKERTPDLEILKILSFEHPDVDQAIFYSQELIKNSQSSELRTYLFHGYFHKGNALKKKGDLKEALSYYFKAAEIANLQNIKVSLGNVNIAIADVYSISNDHQNAVYYYKKAIAIHSEAGNDEDVAIAYENLGDEYLNVSKPDSALIMFQKSGPVFKKLGFTEGIAMNIGNKGIAYALLGQDDLAKSEIAHAINMFEDMAGYQNAISVFLSYMSDIYMNQGDFRRALEYAQESLSTAEKYGLKDEISSANLQLSRIYEASGNHKASLYSYKNYTIYKDSVNNITNVQQMANLRTQFEIAQNQKETDLQIAQKQLEVNRLNQSKKNQKITIIAIAMALVLIIIFTIGLYNRNRYIEKTSRIIEKERNLSDKLLLNILPEQTALELKEEGKVVAKKFDSVSVMFTDFKDFTKHSEGLSPEELVKTVDFYYSKFDEIIKSHDLEKIKTIGDAYMAAGGLPFPTDDHTSKLVKAAINIAEFVENARINNPSGAQRFEIRIGINTGPVVAGVVGTNKFAYDIWGDTVNIASRMESNSKSGKVNISHNSFELIKHEYDCTYRGEIDTKNRGKMKMYFVEGLKNIAHKV